MHLQGKEVWKLLVLVLVLLLFRRTVLRWLQEVLVTVLPLPCLGWRVS